MYTIDLLSLLLLRIFSTTSSVSAYTPLLIPKNVGNLPYCQNRIKRKGTIFGHCERREMLSPRTFIYAVGHSGEENTSTTSNYSSTTVSLSFSEDGSDGYNSDNTSNIEKGTGNKEKDEKNEETKKKKKRESVMAFLRKTGRIGGVKDFSTAMGVDEGPAGQIRSGVSQIEKGRNAYKWCTETGIIDDMSESLPRTSSGTEWSGFTDKVMGGVSIGKVIREVVDGRNANVMKGKVSLYNNGGFIQMATSLSTDPSVSLSVDASSYDGIELEVFYRGDEHIEKFNVHLRNAACLRQFSSYRGTFEACGNEWKTVRLPWSSFVGYGPGSESVPFDPSALRRIGIVAIGKAMEVYLAVSSVGFYKNV